MLCRFLGLIKVKTFGRSEYLLVMKNVLTASGGQQAIVEMYDLKGSTHGRFTPDIKSVNSDNTTIKEKLSSAKENPAKEKLSKKRGSIKIKKDLNFRDENRKFLCLGEKERSNFLKMLKQDTEFLKKLRVLDYSLLVGIRASGSWEVGIIDFLTPYGSKKKLEHVLIGGLHGRDVRENVEQGASEVLIFDRSFLAFRRKPTLVDSSTSSKVIRLRLKRCNR